MTRSQQSANVGGDAGSNELIEHGLFGGESGRRSAATAIAPGASRSTSSYVDTQLRKPSAHCCPSLAGGPMWFVGDLAARRAVSEKSVELCDQAAHSKSPIWVEVTSALLGSPIWEMASDPSPNGHRKELS